MGDYYSLVLDGTNNDGVAHADQSDDLFFLPVSGNIENWTGLTLDLADGDFSDYLANNLGVRMCSGRMKDILHQYHSEIDSIQWLEVAVSNSHETRPYYILYIPEPADVLNPEKTLFAGGSFVVRPVLSKRLATGHKVFAYPEADLWLFVADDVKRALLAAGCTGISFSKAMMAE